MADVSPDTKYPSERPTRELPETNKELIAIINERNAEILAARAESLDNLNSLRFDAAMKLVIEQANVRGNINAVTDHDIAAAVEIVDLLLAKVVAR